MTDCSRKMLSQTLKNLEQNHLIYREVFPEVPPRVEYSLTDTGKSFMPAITALIAWGQEHFDQVVTNEIMEMEEKTYNGRECYLYHNPEALYLLIQPIDEHDLEVLDQEVATIQSLSDKPFSLVAFKIKDWNQELSPWMAPPVFGKIPFGDGAGETLAYILDQLLPALQDEGILTSHCLLGGYSLAGLFSLWAAYQTDRFDGIAAVSPSVWFPQWIAYATVQKPMTNAIYLSLGDKEEKTKNPLMAQVGCAIRRQLEILSTQDINTILEWNPGNHFADSDKRTAKGFAWLLN